MFWLELLILLHCVDEYIEADGEPKVACNVVCGVFLGDYLAQFRSLVPVVSVAICYWLLGKEKMNSKSPYYLLLFSN